MLFFLKDMGSVLHLLPARSIDARSYISIVSTIPDMAIMPAVSGYNFHNLRLSSSIKSIIIGPKVSRQRAILLPSFGYTVTDHAVSQWEAICPTQRAISLRAFC
jgi:hypothetical protein